MVNDKKLYKSTKPIIFKINFKTTFFLDINFYALTVEISFTHSFNHIPLFCKFIINFEFNNT